MSGKGSGRRPGQGYEQNWEAIFGRKRGAQQPVEAPETRMDTEVDGGAQPKDEAKKED